MTLELRPSIALYYPDQPVNLVCHLPTNLAFTVPLNMLFHALPVP